MKIVGFNGHPLKVGRSLPVVQTDNLIAVLDGRTLNWFQEKEMEGRWTKLKNSNFDCDTFQTMIVFADDLLFELADIERPFMSWCELEGYSPTIKAVFMTENSSKYILDHWCKELLDRFDELFGKVDKKKLNQIVDLAVCSAKSKELILKSYKYYIKVQDPKTAKEKAKQVFNTFISKLFPDLTWKDFYYE